MADVTTIFKEKDKICWKLQTSKRSTTVSKIFERRIMQKQITDYIGKFLYPFLSENGKGFPVYSMPCYN